MNILKWVWDIYVISTCTWVISFGLYCSLLVMGVPLWYTYTATIICIIQSPSMFVGNRLKKKVGSNINFLNPNNYEKPKRKYE